MSVDPSIWESSVHPYLHQDHAQIRTNHRDGTQIYILKGSKLYWNIEIWSYNSSPRGMVIGYISSGRLRPWNDIIGGFWSGIIIQRSGILFRRQLEHGRNPSLDVKFLRSYLLTGNLILMVRFIFEVIVFFCAEVYESTMGEYIRTQQALTIWWNIEV